MNHYMIYQLPRSNPNLFRSVDQLSKPINFEDYCCVWADDDVDFNMDDFTICEALFTKFNIAHPKGYGAHSLSVSDVVIIFRGDESYIYFCDSIGFKKVDI